MCQNGTTNFGATVRAIKEDHLRNIPVEPNRNPSICFSTIVFGSLGTIEIMPAHRLIRRIISSVRTFLLRQIFKAYKRVKNKSSKNT